jgi:hypothetical protein
MHLTIGTVATGDVDAKSALTGRQEYVKDGWGEHNRLVALLSDGDFYRIWCVDAKNDDERKKKKNILNILLNSKNEVCEGNALYRKLRADFPITFRTIEDIKRKDHRHLAKQLHRFTADSVGAALLEIQREGIATIPHVDALICQEKNRAVRAVFRARAREKQVSARLFTILNPPLHRLTANTKTPPLSGCLALPGLYP